MGKKTNFFKRAQTWVLTFALLLTVFQPILGFVVTADDSTTIDLTDGEIVSLNYDLTTGEKNLIASGLLVGDERNFKVPTENDELISVDTDNKVITVESYEGWVPVSVKIMVGSTEKETVTLDGSGKGTYSFDGNAFSVKVDYELNAEVADAVQEALLNAPAYLTQAFDNMEAIASVADNLELVAEAVPHFVDFAAGVPLPAPLSGTMSFETVESKTAVNVLNAQLTANGNKLDLQLIIDEYKAAPSKVEYLLVNGTDMKDKAVETLGYLKDLQIGLVGDGASVTGLKTTLSNAISWGSSLMDSTMIDQVNQAISAIGLVNSGLNSAISALEAPCADPWTATTVTLVKSGLIDAEYLALDALINEVVSVTDVSGIVIKNPLVAATTSVQHNLSMFNVSVKVVLKTTQGNVVTNKFVSDTVVLTLAKDATKDEILTAVEDCGIEADSLTAWAGVYLADKFVAEYSDLPATLTEDITYTITYSPKEFSVDEWGTVNSYPYGYVLTLENHANAEKAYDYTVNGAYYAQGSTIKVTEDTVITRKEGKSYKNADLFDIVADNYLSGKGKDILTSGALKGDEVVSVRYPDNSNNIVTLTGDTLKAAAYPSSYKGLEWVAYSYTLQVGGADVKTVLFGGTDTVTIVDAYDYVKVNYRLSLTNFNDAEILEIVNLPDVLAKEAKDQKSALDSFAGKKDTLTQVKSAVINTMMMLVDGLDGDDPTLNADPAKDALVKECLYSALKGIKDNCMVDGTLKLTTLIEAYAGSSDGLKYYYQNSDSFINEITVLSEYLKDMLSEDAKLTADEKLNALRELILSTGVVPAAEVDEYIGKFTNISDLVNEVLDKLQAPNAAIDLGSANLGTLTAALVKSGSTESFVSLPEELHLTDSTIGLAANDKVVLSVTVEVEGGTNFTVTSDAITINTTISSSVIEKLIAVVDAKLDEQGVVGKYYDTTYNKAELEALVGTNASSSTVSSYNYIYSYKDFTVSVPGMADQTVNKGSLNITLAPSADASVRYDYYVDGVKVNDVDYTLTSAQFDKVVDGTLVITREDVDVLGEELVDYVNSLNSNAGDGVVFALVENGGAYSIVMKIDASEPNGLMSAVMGTATGMMMGKYQYVGIRDNAFFDDGKVYLQSIVDALMYSGFGNDTILDVMDENGNINNISIPGTVVSSKPLTTYGGELLTTTMQLGPNKASAFSVPFYITLGSVSAEMVDVRNAIDGQVSNNFKLQCFDGKANLKLNLPEKAYEAFLAVLLVTEKIDLANIDAVNSEIAIGFFNDLLIPVLSTPEVTVTTFDNTLSKFGFNLDLASKKGSEALYNSLVDFYTGASFTYNATTGTMAGVLDISDAIDALNLGSLAGVIAEKNTGIKITMTLTIDDLSNEYEALFVDVKASGVTNKVGLTNNLASKLSEIEGAASIVLLDDVNADLVFDTTTLLNLNGFTVNGDITGNGKVIIVDSNLADSVDGEVTGAVSGNVIIVGGKYAADVSSFVKAGFVQNSDGVVENEFYALYEDANGDLIVEVDAGLFNTTEIPNAASLVLELASDLVFNGYTSNYLEIDGNVVYDITVEDLVALYSKSNRLDSVVEEVLTFVDTAELSALINTVLDDSFDFTAISDAIANNAPVYSYEFVTKPWGINFRHETTEDYLTAGIVSGEPGTTRNLKVYVVGEDNEKAAVSDIFAELGKTTSADVNVTLEHGKNGKELFLNASANVDVFSDLTDPAYAVMFSVIIADGIGAPANEALVDGIEKYYELDNMAPLTKAFNDLTTAQVITALKNLGMNDEFSDMVDDLGLTGVVGSEVEELEAIFDRAGKLAAAVVRKADLEGGNRTLASFVDADGAYGMTRSNVERIVDKVLLKGYSAVANVEVTDFYVGAKLFEDGTIPLDPEFVEGTGIPEITVNDKIAGSKVDTVNGIIILDTIRNGITVAELRDLIVFSAINADTIEVIVGDGTLADDALVPNGTKITAIASNALSLNPATVEYTIIILGDVNGNGRVDVGDATLISKKLVDEIVFDANQTLAADVNDDSSIKIADAVKITKKIVYWDEYESSLDK